MTTDDLVSVRFVGFPLEVQSRAAARYDALMREFAIIRSQEPDDSVPNRLQELVDDLTRRFGRFGEPLTAEIEAARERGESSIDLVYEVPPAVDEAARQFNALLDEANDYCRAGRHLVTLEETGDILAFRRWFLDEFTNQIAGAPPTPWSQVWPPDTAPSTPAPSDHTGGDGAGRTDVSSVVIPFTGELDIATAETLRRQVNELREQGVTDIVVDVAGMTFIDSVGLSIVIALHLRLAESGASLQLCRPTLAVRRMLEVAGLEDELLLDGGDAGGARATTGA